jgi:hypothetical protein
MTTAADQPRVRKETPTGGHHATENGAKPMNDKHDVISLGGNKAKHDAGREFL